MGDKPEQECTPEEDAIRTIARTEQALRHARWCRNEAADKYNAAESEFQGNGQNPHKTPEVTRLLLQSWRDAARAVRHADAQFLQATVSFNHATYVLEIRRCKARLVESQGRSDAAGRQLAEAARIFRGLTGTYGPPLHGWRDEIEEWIGSTVLPGDEEDQS